MSELASSLIEHRELLRFRLLQRVGADCVQLLQARLRFIAMAIISGP